MKKNLQTLFLLFFIALILALSLRGNFGSVTLGNVANNKWTENGPFELSPERSRFALTYSLVESGSFWFDVEVARFILPDLGYHNGHYVSLFAPGASFIVAPGYMLGKALGISQLGSYAVISMLALANAYLIKKISDKLGSSGIVGWISALIFLFASPAFAYAVSLYQHHISVFLLLLSLYSLLRWRPIWSPAVVGFAFAASISVDYPNFFMLLPILVFALLQALGGSLREKIKWRKGILAVSTLVAAGLIPLAVFFWSNYKSYGNPFRLAGTVEDVHDINQEGLPVQEAPEDEQLMPTQGARKTKKPLAFFRTRNIINGLRVHLISPDRGIIYFTPVMLFSVIGFIRLQETKPKIGALLISVVGANILLYSMWGDPWGGWAFGSRYLIPSYALMALSISYAIPDIVKKKGLHILFFLAAAYSIAVNTLGAITTNRIPPKEEAIMLEQESGKKESYTFLRNWDYLLKGGSKSYFYQTAAVGSLEAIEYYQLIAIMIIAVFGISLTKVKTWEEDTKRQII